MEQTWLEYSWWEGVVFFRFNKPLFNTNFLFFLATSLISFLLTPFRSFHTQIRILLDCISSNLFNSHITNFHSLIGDRQMDTAIGININLSIDTDIDIDRYI